MQVPRLTGGNGVKKILASTIMTQPYDHTVDEALSAALAKAKRKIVVLDDDPTGVQTVHNVPVYTTWTTEAITSGFADESPVFFILTNSRGMPAVETEIVHRDIGIKICAVSRDTGKDFIVVSRSDSTLRGHFPLETSTLRNAIESASSRRYNGEILLPFFQEGGRYTIENIHYVRDAELLIPAGETEFAHDTSFGYASSHLGEYVEEKTAGSFKKESCAYISLEDLRSGDLRQVAATLEHVNNFDKVIVNATDYLDVKRFAISYLFALSNGHEFIFRSAAAVPKVLGGITDRPLLSRNDIIDPANQNGGIIIIGSHVNKTTNQFEELLSCRVPLNYVQFDQHCIAEDGGLEQETKRVTALASESIVAGKNVVIFTRRERYNAPTDNPAELLAVSTRISDALVGVIANLVVQPNFIIAKGGITSSDVGVKALGVKRAVVMGQISPGVPVWMTGPESKFPGMPFVIFPGNVGEDCALRDIVDCIS